MNTPHVRKILIAVWLLTLPILAQAGSALLRTNDASGGCALTNNTGTNWTISGPISAANDYYTSNWFVRTPPGGNMTFAGNSLTLQTPNNQASPARSILFKGVNGSVITINNVTNAGGIINFGSGSGAVPTFNGNLMTVISNSTIQADQSSVFIGWPLAGSGDLTNTSVNSTTITYTNNNSAFTGRFVITGTLSVAFNSTNGAPGNPAVPTPSQIDLGAGCTLLDNAGITYTNANGGLTLEGTSTINASATNLLGTVPTTIGVPITDNGNNFTLIKRGLSILTLGASNSFGNLTMLTLTAGSQININNPHALGNNTFDLAGGAVTAALLDNTSGSNITMTANNPLVWSNSFTFKGSSSLNMGSGPVTLGASVTANVTNSLTVGAITDGGLNFALTKSGPGTLTVVGGGTYTSSTIVNNGVLAITGSGSLSSTNISLGTNGTLDMTAVGGLTMVGGETFGGGGTFNGPLSDSSGTAILPGGNNAAGTLTINGSLSLNGSGSLNFDLNNVSTTGAGVNDLIVVSGALTANGTTPINVNLLNGTPFGVYTVIEYGSFSGTAANFSAPAGFVVTNNTSLNAIQLVITHLPVNLTWQGDGMANIWDVATTADWIQSGTNQVFNIGDFVTFDNTGSASPPVSINAIVSPSSTTVNSSQTYDFTGSAIASGTLTKSGTGTLILENNNTYAAPTIINGGILHVGNSSGGSAGTSGTLGTGNVTNNATLVLDRSDTVYTVANAISGSGAVAMSGAGGIGLSASNSYTGLTTVSNGTIFVQNASALGATNSGTVVQGGAVLYITANVNITNEALTIAGNGGGNGALRKGGAGATVYTGPVTLSADAGIAVDGGATLTLTNAAGIVATNNTLTLGGPGTGIIVGPLALGTGGLSVSGGTWTVSPTNNYTGQTALSTGTLRVADTQALGPVPVVFTPNQIDLEDGALEFVTNLTTAVTFNDGNVGFSVDGTGGTLIVDAGMTLTISNQISGAANLTKAGPGTLVLNGSNSFSGQFFVDTINNSSNDGVVLITSSNALVNVPATPGTATIHQGNNNSGFSILKLDGTINATTLPQEFNISCRNNGNPNIENVAGSNLISGNMDIIQGGSDAYFQSDAGLFTLGGTMQYQGSLANPRTFVFQGAGNTLVSGPIIAATSAAAPVSVIKFGPGTLTLSGANTYENATTISNGVLLLTGSITSTGGVSVVSGTLAGGGTINDSVTVQSGGTLTPGLGNQSIGTLTINGGLTLAGVTSVDINKNTSSSDLVTGLTSVTYGGTLAVTNLAGTLALGNSFTLFSAAASSGNFTSIVGSPGAGLGYSFNPTNGVLSVVAVASNPTPINLVVNGNQLNLSWAPDHLGWILQSQTNSAGISTNNANWFDLAGSASVTNVVFTANLTNPTVFYRLRHP